MEEKQQRLFDAAHALFLTQGFKATNISAIAAGANVAVGTFYNFYQSKTAIFIQVYNAENDRVKRTILANVDFDQAPNPLIKTILKQILDQSADNRILQEWFTNAKLNAIIAKTNAVLPLSPRPMPSRSKTASSMPPWSPSLIGGWRPACSSRR